MAQAVYIHIPFCEQICHYCDFNKFFIKNQPVDDYLDMLSIEMKNTVRRFTQDKMQTAFIGGGTPTALNIQQLDKLLDSILQTFTFKENYEFTIEANPGNLDREKLSLLKQAGVNRLSIGVQAFQNDLLARIGRDHSDYDIYSSVTAAQEEGFTNISIDLMFGLPGQTLAMFEESLKKALELQVDHLSAYSLQIEPRTIFNNMLNRGELHLPPADVEADMFTHLIKTMRNHGFKQYEISNYAKENKESKHNLTYWNNDDYYGIGAGAHSLISGVRRANIGPLTKYMNLIREKGFAFMEEHPLTRKEQQEEEMFMGLRKLDGVSKVRFIEKYGTTIDAVFGDVLFELLERGLITNNSERVALTERGVYLGNEVFQAFLTV